MSRTLFIGLGLLPLLLASSSCSEDASNARPTGGVLTGTGGRTSGGAPGSGGTANAGGSKASGGTGGGSASGGAIGSGATGGTGGAGGLANRGGAAGSVMCNSGATVPDLTNCDTAKVAAFFKAGKKCEGCHFSPDDPNDFTLNKLHEFDTEEGLNVLVGRITRRAAFVDCGTKTLVEPGNAEASLMYLKLKGAPPNCGLQMPKPEGARPQCSLTADELKCVADWINGLPPNGAGGQGGTAN